MDGLVREYADALLERPAKVVKKTKLPQALEPSEMEKQIRRWKDQGYDVSSVEAALGGDPGTLMATVLAMRDAVKRAEGAWEALSNLDLRGFESRAAILREKLRDPLRNPDFDAEVENLREAVQDARRSEARRKIEAVRERDSHERTRKLMELVMRRRHAAPPEAVRREIAAIPKPARERPSMRRAETNLVPSFTFEGFTVGESNRFAHGSAVAVAKEPGKAYNPLLITSGPGLGKTHLLHAIGNYIVSHHPGKSVLYLTCEAFSTRLAESRKGGSLGAFRDLVRRADCLLLDDLQFLSSMPDIHEEMFYTFNDLHQSDKQIVLASDRSPKAIPNLDERLASRFESGLVVGLEPPELPTRIAILERRSREAKVPMQAEVLTQIATFVEGNVRELGGALNRVIAFSSMMGRPITADLVREVLAPPVPEPAQVAAAVPIPAADLEPAADPEPAVDPEPAMRMEPAARTETAPSPPAAAPAILMPGHSYLIEESRPAEAFRRFIEFLAGGAGGLVITRTNPKRAREEHELVAQRVLWLTDREGSDEETIAPALERIVYEIESFLEKQPRGAVLLDGIEYLVSNNSFEAVLKFVRRLLDTFSESRHAFIISLGPETMKEQELKVLEREMEVIRVA